MKYSTGSRGSSLIASRPGINRVSRPASRSGPLATDISETCESPRVSKISFAALSWPRPPSMMTRSAHCGTPSSSFLGPPIAPLSRLRDHPLSGPRRYPFGLDVEFAILVLDEPIRARHDHCADRIGALDV